MRSDNWLNRIIDTIRYKNLHYLRVAAYGDDARIARGVVFKHPERVWLGNHVAIDAGVYVTTRFKCGDYVHISPQVTVIGGADALFWMGNFTTVAAGCRIICRSDKLMGEGLVSTVIPTAYRDTCFGSNVVMADFCNLATNVVVYPDVLLREGSVALSMSVVSKSTTAWTIYRGVPAKPYKRRKAELMKSHARQMGYNA